MNSNAQHLLCAAVLTFLAGSSAAQATWTRQSPLPYPPQLASNEIAFSGTRGYIVGSSKHLLETTDGGATWHERVLSGPTYNDGVYYGVTFSGPMNGWIVGDNLSWSNSCFRTVDGGVSWTQMDILPNSAWSHVDFGTPARGWVGGWGALYVTSDGGSSWSPQNFGVIDRVDSMNFFDSNVGVLSSQGALRRTQDGGQTWTVVHGHEAFAIEWLDALTVIASTNSSGGPDFARSTDGGLTWQTLEVPGVDLAVPVRVDATTLIAGNYDADLYRSTDAGLSWSKVWDGLKAANMNAGVFRSPTQGFMVGSGNLIYRTGDGGLSWTYASNGFGMEFEDLKMFDSQRGLVAGGGGTILRTANGGRTWTPTRPGWTHSNGDYLMDLSLVAPAFAFASGNHGTMVKTLDAGLTWQGVAAPTGFPNGGTGDYSACSFISPSEGWIAGRYLEITHTTDGGASWQQQYVGGSSEDGVYDMDFVDGQHGWLVGSFGSGVLLTADGGSSWNFHGFPAPSPDGRSVDFVNPLVGWAASSNGWVARSTDGGLTWTRQVIPGVGIGTHLESIQAIDVNECWVASIDNGRVFHTTNAGSMWTELATPFHDPYDGYTGIAATPSGEVWVAGHRGVVSHFGYAAPLSYCTAKTTSNGCTPAIGSSGTASATAGIGFVVNATGMINNKPCLLLYGTSGAAAFPFAGGLLCIQGPIKRSSGTGSAGNPPPNDCSGVPGIDMNLFAVGGLGGAPSAALTLPGTLVYCQWWGRDHGFPVPSNAQLSNGLEYTVKP